MHQIKFSRIEEQSDKPLIGMVLRMTLSSDTTANLWRSFMPRRHEIQGAIGSALYSVQSYDRRQDFQDFSPQTEFEKWAALEVANGAEVPEGMERFVLQGGYYAVFDHRGPPIEFPKTAAYIFTEWLPQSDWSLDDREHFEILQPGWRVDDPEASEEVWIPVKRGE